LFIFSSLQSSGYDDRNKKYESSQSVKVFADNLCGSTGMLLVTRRPRVLVLSSIAFKTSLRVDKSSTARIGILLQNIRR
jgi:hypothetical protein